MPGTKSKSYDTVVKLWLLKAAILCSVFTFSGFNEKIYCIYLEAVKTELVESKNYNPALILDSFVTNNSKKNSTGFSFDLKPTNSFKALSNSNHSITIAYKAICKKFLSHNYTSTILLIKISPASSEDEILLFSLG